MNVLAGCFSFREVCSFFLWTWLQIILSRPKCFFLRHLQEKNMLFNQSFILHLPVFHKSCYVSFYHTKTKAQTTQNRNPDGTWSLQSNEFLLGLGGGRFSLCSVSLPVPAQCRVMLFLWVMMATISSRSSMQQIKCELSSFPPPVCGPEVLGYRRHDCVNQWGRPDFDRSVRELVQWILIDTDWINANGRACWGGRVSVVDVIWFVGTWKTRTPASSWLRFVRICKERVTIMRVILGRKYQIKGGKFKYYKRNGRKTNIFYKKNYTALRQSPQTLLLSNCLLKNQTANSYCRSHTLTGI